MVDLEISFEEGISKIKLFFIPVTPNGGPTIVKDIKGNMIGVYKSDSEAQIACNKYFIPKGIKPMFYYHMIGE